MMISFVAVHSWMQVDILHTAAPAVHMLVEAVDHMAAVPVYNLLAMVYIVSGVDRMEAVVAAPVHTADSDHYNSYKDSSHVQFFGCCDISILVDRTDYKRNVL
jgi:hypothetical protein